MRYLVIDIATCPIDGADAFIEEPSAPSNWKDPDKIAAYVAEKKAEGTSKCGLDADLGRIAGIGLWLHDDQATDTGLTVTLCKTEDEERAALAALGPYLDKRRASYTALVGYNALKFDWPFIARRALYLGVPLTIELDRYRTPHIDLAERLTHRGLLPMRSLGFYVKRLGWSDLTKALSGAEEALAPARGQWAELEASIVHDVTATRRLAEWMGVIPSAREAA